MPSSTVKALLVAATKAFVVHIAVMAGTTDHRALFSFDNTDRTCRVNEKANIIGDESRFYPFYYSFETACPDGSFLVGLDPFARYYSLLTQMEVMCSDGNATSIWRDYNPRSASVFAAGVCYLQAEYDTSNRYLKQFYIGGYRYVYDGIYATGANYTLVGPIYDDTL